MSSIFLESLDFAPTAEDFVLFTFILCRISGMLVIAPLLTAKNLGVYVRMFLSIFLSLLVLMALYKYYRGPHPFFQSRSLGALQGSWIFLLLTTLKELAVGYLLGFCFTLIFEATLLAGTIIDAMTGFATAESYDPISAIGHSYFTPILGFFVLLLALALDLHHQFIKVLSDSFIAIPFGDYNMPNEAMTQVLTSGTSRIFTYGLKIATVPFISLSLGIIGVGFVARIVPEFNPLLMGLPMRVLIALWAMMMAASHIPPIIKDGFLVFQDFSRYLIQLIGGQ